MALPFKIKTFSQITQSLVNWMSSAQSAVTDFNVGSVTRTLLEAVASELAEVYYRIFEGVLSSQEVAVYNSFDFPRQAAASATGVVLWQTAGLPAQAITLPFGSQAAVPATNVTPEISFSSTAAALIPAQTTLNGAINNSVTAVAVTTAVNMGIGDVFRVDSEKMHITGIAVNTLTVVRGYEGTTAVSHLNAAACGIVGKAVSMTADLPGVAGNVSALTVSKINTPVVGIVSVTNEAAFNGGLDLETDDARKKRFAAYVSGLARGTKPAMEFGAKTATGCVKARAFDLDDDGAIPTGTIKLYVAYSDGTADATLLTNVGTVIEAYKPAGAMVVIAGPTVTAVNVTAVLTIAAGFDKPTVVAAVKQTLTDYLTSLTMGDAVYTSRLIQAMIDTNAAAIRFVTLTVPGADVAIANDHIARPGTLLITAA